ncbi:MAG: AAA family ATPase, partial [Gemmatimonadota bacterium]|nr:AAA family ATPase [Gemmatimonadota bacterium]
MLELRCFGQVTVVDEAGTVCSLRSRKHVGLLLYLVAHARTTHTREDLSDLLWDGTGRRERHSLSQALYDIRSNGGDVLDLSTTTVRMRRDSVLYEAAQFERAVETRDHVKALDLYRGEFAPELAGLGAEVFDRWHDSERERCRVLASIALRNAQRAAEERGNWDRMCLAALRLIRMNEFDEEAHCALMRGLWMKGDPASALRHYRSLRPDRVAGWRTVRDLAERIESSGSVREVLTVPREPVELIGREEEFQTLYDAIRTHGARGATVVISGEPGVGRTALVTEFVRLASASGGSVGHLERANDTARGAWPRIVVVDGDAIPTTPPPIRLPNLMTLVTTTAVDRLWPEGDLQADVVLSLTRLEPQEVLRLVASRVSGITDSTADAAARLSGGNPALALKIAAVLVVRGLPAGGTSAEIEEAGRVALRSSSRLREIVEAWQKSLPQEAFDLARRVACLRPRTVEALYSLGALGAWGNGFSQLEDRGCLKFAAAGITMTPPITSLAFASTGDGRHAAFRRDAVAQLEGGSPAQRYAAATELADAGHRVEARRMLSQAARLASKEGDLETASRAGTLASVRALTPQERFET